MRFRAAVLTASIVAIWVSDMVKDETMRVRAITPMDSTEEIKKKLSETMGQMMVQTSAHGLS